MERNVLGTPLQACSFDPLTGFLRDGCCSADEEDVGQHWVCVRMTAEFLAFSKSKGNDLSTPRHAYRFAGLKPTDRWCLCAARWLEAYEAGAAPPVVLEATHAKTLESIPLAALQQHAYPKSTASH